MPAAVAFGVNKFALGTRYEELGMLLRNDAEPLFRRAQQARSDSGDGSMERPTKLPCIGERIDTETRTKASPVESVFSAKPASAEISSEAAAPAPPAQLAPRAFPSLLRTFSAVEATPETSEPVSVDECPGRLHLDSPFPPGLYALERCFTPACAAAFTGMLKDVLATP